MQVEIANRISIYRFNVATSIWNFDMKPHLWIPISNFILQFQIEISSWAWIWSSTSILISYWKFKWNVEVEDSSRNLNSHPHEQVKSLTWTMFFNLRTFLNHIVNNMCANEFRAYNFCANYNFLDFTCTYEFRTHVHHTFDFDF